MSERDNLELKSKKVKNKYMVSSENLNSKDSDNSYLYNELGTSRESEISENKKRIELAPFRSGSIFSFNKITFPYKVIAMIFWLLIWAILAMKINSNIIIAGPYDVLLKLLDFIKDKRFYLIIFTSSFRIILAFIISIISATLLSLLASKYKPVEILLYPIISTLRTIPVASIIIVLFLFFRSKSIPLIVSLMMILPLMYSSMLAAIKNKNVKLEELARVYKVPFFIRLKDLYINQVLLILKPALENSMAFAFKSAIAAEVIANPHMTIGSSLYEAKIYLNTEELFAWTFVCIILSIIFEKGLKFLLNYLKKCLEAN